MFPYSFIAPRPTLPETPPAGLVIKSSPIKLLVTRLASDVHEQVSVECVRIYTALSPLFKSRNSCIIAQCEDEEIDIKYLAQSHSWSPNLNFMLFQSWLHLKNNLWPLKHTDGWSLHWIYSTGIPGNRAVPHLQVYIGIWTCKKLSGSI